MRRERDWAPVAVSEHQRFAGPGRSGRNSWRFSGSELVGDVSGSVAFATTRYVLNPGIASSFPWLSGEADKWEQYRFHRLTYRYVPRCASTTAGSVLLSPDYNVRDQPPSDEVEAADTLGAAESSAWSGFKADLNVNAMYPLGPKKMVRTAVVAGDMNLYDSGAFYVSTTGEADASLIGKLWVDYDIELFVPQNSPADNSGSSRISSTSKATSQTFTTNVFAKQEFDAFAEGKNPFGITYSSGDFTPPAGCYRVDFGASYNDATAETYSVEQRLQKDGTTVIQNLNSSSALGGYLSGNGSALISVDGSNAIAVNVRLIGAAGVLTSTTISPYIMFSPA